MNRLVARILGFAAVAGGLLVRSASAAEPAAVVTDALPSWNDGGAKRAILEFVAKVTREGGPDYVPPAERIATFDNDGTIWAEQPLYFQLLFAMDRVKALAPRHPEWKEKEPFRSLLRGDPKAGSSARTRTSPICRCSSC